MAIFEFNCSKHGVFEELIIKNSDIIALVNGEVDVVCPKCGEVCQRFVSKPAKMKTNWSKWGNQ